MASTTGTSRKRLRSDTAATSREETVQSNTVDNPTPWERVDEIWYEDGNVILVVENKAFRVYQGLLSRHSPVFRDMFKIPQPETAESEDRCPIVRLSGDTAADWVHVLRISLQRAGSLWHAPLCSRLAVVRIGHKYEMNFLRDQALKHLKQVFTDRFPDFDNVEDHLCAFSVEARIYDAIAAVNLSRLTGEISMLPFALYVCCQLHDELVHGCEEGGLLEKLAPEDIVRCVTGKTKLAQANAAAFFRTFLWGEYYSLCCKDNCEQAFHEIITHLGQDSDNHVADSTPLEAWSFAITNYYRTKLCTTCLRRLREKERFERVRIWDSLPSYFNVDLPTWPKTGILPPLPELV
ncbi:hypothetical protein OBBRIDRAFT_741863 [Obba rivulosa]|uniref:BTB domain-containing protein n=1 Tax=Obba rivulosa TaxID=1052685 RepID=A0A8E2AGZ1_9APHY|nr:hypothetical protein OBBRIDRAFT_741863 [Obba rivulosa]